jgi:hypothetical protein
MKSYSLYIFLAVIVLICAFAFNAYFLSNAKEGHTGCSHGESGSSGSSCNRSINSRSHSYSRDRGWVYGRGYYNSGHYLGNEGGSTSSNSWLWYPSIFYLFPPQKEIIVRPYQSVYYA